MIDCLQAVFTFLWTIWTSKNLVTHGDKNPNPLEVILTAQKLFCRYKEAFNMEGNRVEDPQVPILSVKAWASIGI